VLQALRNGDFGACSLAEIDAYRVSCHGIFPLAVAFAPEIPNGIDKPANGDEKLPTELCEADSSIASSSLSATTSELSDGIAA